MPKVDDDGNIILYNQVIAKAGNVRYEGGVVAYRSPETLRSLTGKSAALTLSHPIDNNRKSIFLDEIENMDGYQVEDYVIGQVSDIRFDESTDELLSTITLFKGQPFREGYSIGVYVNEYAQFGSYKGDSYNIVSDITGLDHVAYTSHPNQQLAVARVDEGIVTKIDPQEFKSALRRYIYNPAILDNSMGETTDRRIDALDDTIKTMKNDISNLVGILTKSVESPDDVATKRIDEQEETIKKLQDQIRQRRIDEFVAQGYTVPKGMSESQLDGIAQFNALNSAQIASKKITSETRRSDEGTKKKKINIQIPNDVTPETYLGADGNIHFVGVEYGS